MLKEIASASLVNVVGTDSLDQEMDLEELYLNLLSHELISEVSQTDSGLCMSFVNIGGTVIMYRSGKYNLMGFDSIQKLKKASEQTRTVLSNIGDERIFADSSVSISNYVYTFDLDKEINLPILSSEIGSVAVYEPEQNPFLIYQPLTVEATMTVSSSGKCVINTSNGEQGVDNIVDQFRQYLD